jgi:hypothetical protein
MVFSRSSVDLAVAVGDAATRFIERGFGVVVTPDGTRGWRLRLIQDRVGGGVPGIRAGLEISVEPVARGFRAVARPGMWKARSLGARLWASLLWPVVAPGVWLRLRAARLDDLAIRIVGESIGSAKGRRSRARPQAGQKPRAHRG